jgi:hypothetical protein
VDLVAPYGEYGLTAENDQVLTGTAAMAWNLSLLPEARLSGRTRCGTHSIP